MNIREIREKIRQVDSERARVRALESLADIVMQFTEERTVTLSPAGRIMAWLRKDDRLTGEKPARDITLTREERNELIDWLRLSAWQRKKRADAMEAEIVASRGESDGE
ncbi:MAG: hypothetical protein LCH36_10285 [Actinobacteria bacterium]|nr:hypothetical protein [Actinomycetota bacterium]